MVESVCFEASGYVVEFYRDSGPSGEGCRVYPMVLEPTNSSCRDAKALHLNCKRFGIFPLDLKINNLVGYRRIPHW